MDGTIIQSGSFTSTGLPVTLQIRSDVDVMVVRNFTNAAAAAAGGTEFTWFRGMAPGAAIQKYKAGAADALSENTLTAGGFTLVNQGPSAPTLSTDFTFTATSNSATPVITTPSTAGFADGDIVILGQAAANQVVAGILGIPFQVNVSAVNTLTVTNAFQNMAPAGANAGSLRKVLIDSSYYPSLRYIVKVDTANALAPIITTSVNHGYKVGQTVTFGCTSFNGMSQLNGVTATIIAVPDAARFTVDLDTTGFNAFVFPVNNTAVNPGSGYTPAIVVPSGIDMAEALAQSVSVHSDATRNATIIGMQLGAGDNGPAGTMNDVIYWYAIKSFSVSTTV